jgi:hypothetical protein
MLSAGTAGERRKAGHGRWGCSGTSFVGTYNLPHLATVHLTARIYSGQVRQVLCSRSIPGHLVNFRLVLGSAHCRSLPQGSGRHSRMEARADVATRQCPCESLHHPFGHLPGSGVWYGGLGHACEPSPQKAAGGRLTIPLFFPSTHSCCLRVALRAVSVHSPASRARLVARVCLLRCLCRCAACWTVHVRVT